MKVKILFFMLTTCCVSASIASDSPKALSDEDPILATPAGNVSYARIPHCLYPPSTLQEGGFTWFYVGGLDDSVTKQKCSFQTFLVAPSSEEKHSNGYYGFYFAFKDEKNQQIYANNTYGGEDQVPQALKQGVCGIQWDQASPEAYKVSANLLIDDSIPKPAWSIQKISSMPQPPLYDGKVGQPGAVYSLISQGSTFLWQYDDKGTPTIKPYNYRFNFELLDTRGVVSEGYGGAYVGSSVSGRSLAFNGSRSFMSSYEITQPLLKVQAWSVQFSSFDQTTSSLKNEYTFGGETGFLWADLQRYLSSSAKQIKASLFKPLRPLISQYHSQFATHLGLEDVTALNSQQQSWSLYNGNWITVQFQQGIYSGCALTTTAMWNKNTPNPSTQTTDDPNWCTRGFMNLFTGRLTNDEASALTVTETLKKGNPGMNINLSEENHFQLKVTRYADQKKYNLAFPWATGIEITIKPHSQIRYALAAYAHRKNTKVIDDVSKPITLTIEALYPFTQNTVFTKNYTQFYEGAASVSINTESVGSSWIEHMVDLNTVSDSQSTLASLTSSSASSSSSSTSLPTTSGWLDPLYRYMGYS